MREAPSKYCVWPPGTEVHLGFNNQRSIPAVIREVHILGENTFQYTIGWWDGRIHRTGRFDHSVVFFPLQTEPADMGLLAPKEGKG